MTPQPGPEGTPAQRWLARLSFVLAGLAVVIVVVFAGLKSLPMLAVGLAGAAVSLAAAFLFLSRRGLWRWLSLAVFVLAPIAVIVVFALRNVLWNWSASASCAMPLFVAAELNSGKNSWRLPLLS